MFFCTFWHKSVQFLSISQRIYHSLSAKLKNPCVFVYFPGARSNRSNPISYSFYLIGLLWSGDLRETSQTAKHCLVWVSFVFAQNGKHWSCSTCLAMLHTAQFREGSYSFVVKHWVKSSKRVENAGFSAHFGTKVYNSCQFSREIIILYQQNSKNPAFLHIFQALIQIEAIPYPIAPIWLDCFEMETLEKHPNCKKLSRFGLVCLCPKWKTLGRAQPALQCCTLHSLERDHTHLWSNIELKVQNELKMQGFLHILAQKCTVLVNFPENFSYFISKAQKKTCVFAYFSGARTNRSNS